MARAARRGLGPLALPPVLLVTDPARLERPEDIVGRLPTGWGVVYRHFGEAGRALRARALVAAGRRRRVTVLIAADPPLARAARAHGVHWPGRLWRGGEGRDWRRRGAGTARGSPVAGRLVTVSARRRRALAASSWHGAAAALVSPVFASDSPTASSPRLGRQRFRRLASSAGIPCYALAGMGLRHVAGAPFAALDALRSLSAAGESIEKVGLDRDTDLDSPPFPV